MSAIAKLDQELEEIKLKPTPKAQAPTIVEGVQETPKLFGSIGAPVFMCVFNAMGATVVRPGVLIEHCSWITNEERWSLRYENPNGPVYVQAAYSEMPKVGHFSFFIDMPKE